MKTSKSTPRRDTGSTTSNWQPSALDVSSPTYAGPRAGQRTAGDGQRTSLKVGQALMLAAAVVGLVVFGFFLGRPSTAPDSALPAPVAVLEIARGPVNLYASADAGALQPLAFSPGQSLPVGTIIETGTVRDTGSVTEPRATEAAPRASELPQPALAADRTTPFTSQPGRAAFRLGDGASVRLDAGSRVRLAANDALVLERGAVYVDAARVASVEVRTTLGTVRDIGTQFEVRLLEDSSTDPALRVRVREGLIVLRHQGSEHEAGVGTELTLHGDGTVERDTVATSGPHWAWILDAAPLPDIEGQKLSFFLDWLRRESGWTVSFADDATEERALGTVLHGSLKGLSLAEAMTVVFESSSLDFTVVEGELLLFPTEAEER